MTSRKGEVDSPRLGTAYPHTGPGHPYSNEQLLSHVTNGAERWSEQGQHDGPSIQVGPGAVVEADGDEPVDPDEKTYCYCDTVSYGEMIGCDDENCPREWVCCPW